MFDLTPNNIKIKLEAMGVLRFSDKKGKYVPASEDAKYINDCIYINKDVLSRIVKLKFVVETAETIGLTKLAKNYDKSKKSHIFTVYQLSNANSKRNLEELKSIRKILSLD